MKRLFRYLNPIRHLGDTNYSVFFPLAATLLLCVLSEFYAYGIAKDPMAVGTYIIVLNVSFIIYFAFREGLKGGVVSAAVSVLYYFYIVHTRNYSGDQLTTATNTIVVLGVLYLIVGGIVGWLKQTIDRLICAQADEKRRLETIIQQLPVGVLITDGKGVLQQRNRKIDSILGVKIPIGFVIGKDPLEREKIDDKPINPSESPLHQALRTGRQIIGKEFLFMRADGKEVSLEVNAAPILNSKRKIIAAVSLVSDVTQQKALERQKDDFLAIASHELKTPITSIKAYAQMLMGKFERKNDTRSVEHLKKLDIQANKLNNLISDLLDVTKIQSGKLEFHREKFDFNTLVQEITEELQLTNDTHKIVKKLAKTTSITSDRDRIGQVIINFISNAVKYSPDSKRVVLETALTKDTVTLKVTDFGVGIPKEKQYKVFEQFFRVSGKRENTFPGLGLGLYISSEIIKREGGRIWVESAPGKGSTFCFSLPLIKKYVRSKPQNPDTNLKK